MALLVFRPRFRPQRCSPPRRSGSLLSHLWAGGSRAGPSPAWSCPPDFPRRPGVCSHGALSLPVASPALKPPSWVGGSSPRGRSASSRSPPDSGATSGGAAALSSLTPVGPSPLRGGDPPGRSPSPLGSSLPWAAPGGTPGAAAQVPDSALATLLVPGPLCSSSPRCNCAAVLAEVVAPPKATGPQVLAGGGLQIALSLGRGHPRGALTSVPSSRWPRPPPPHSGTTNSYFEEFGL